jgi:glutaredoxin-related protein
MKGTPSAPQCGFSRATVQILGIQGVDPNKFASYNVLEDPELRSGTHPLPSVCPSCSFLTVVFPAFLS